MRKREGQERRAKLAEQHPVPVQEIIERFNAGDYRGCVEPLEVLWWRDRSDFVQALIQVCVALHQFRRGLRDSPQTLIQSALETFSTTGWRGEGLDASDLEPLLRRLNDHLAHSESGKSAPTNPIGELRADPPQ